MLEREQTDFFLVNACNAALAAGKIIMDIFTGMDDLGITLKSDNTPVTLADRKSHEIIKNILSGTRIPLMSEEGRHILYEERYGWDLYWLVDPLDGTMEFIHHRGEFTVNIALMYNNEPLFGVIYVPAEKELFFSDPYRGAFKKSAVEQSGGLKIDALYKDSQPLKMEDADLDHLRVAVTRSHLKKEMVDYLEGLKSTFPGLEVIHKGSALKFCMLADNKADLFIRKNIADEWDTAAGEAIVKAAGGKILHLDGKPLVYNKKELSVGDFYAAKNNVFL